MSKENKSTDGSGSTGTAPLLPPKGTHGFYKGQHAVTVDEVEEGIVTMAFLFPMEGQDRQTAGLVKDFQRAPVESIRDAAPVAKSAEPVQAPAEFTEPAVSTLPAKEPMPLLHWALACVRRGWFVFPCYPRSKKPAGEIVPNGWKDASNDEKQIRLWWTRNPEYNPAIALGPSGLVVYDFDEIKPFENLPPTFTVKTGRVPVDGIEGTQMYYIGSTNTHAHTAGGGEVRSRGAYVMAPGSIHPSGNAYKIISNLPLAHSPERSEEFVKPSEQAIGTDAQEVIATYVEAAFGASGIDYRSRVSYEGGFKWLNICPWESEHSEGKAFDSSTAVIMLPSGELLYCCQHKHCKSLRQWKELRAWMEKTVGHPLQFGDPQPSNILIDGKTLEESDAEMKEAVERKVIQAEAENKAQEEATQKHVTSLISQQDERQREYDQLAEECDRDEQEHQDHNPYPLDAWEGTPYHLFAETGSRDNHIPPEYLVSSLMTITGAVCGNRISPDFSRSIDGRLYTILLSRVGQIGKGECCSWGLEVYNGTGLIFRNNEPRASKNIGTWVGDFGSGRGMLEKFTEQPSVLQYYPEVSTAFEKFGINGSGSAFKDLNLNLYDATYPLWGFIKGMKIPESAPKQIFNSILASTTTPKWDIMHTQYHSEDFFQRQNIVPSDETRRVFALVSPDVTPTRNAVLPRVGLLVTHRLVWSFSPEAKTLGETWFNEHQEGIWGSEEMSDVFGRIQVFIHRILCHLALWLGPLPTTTTKQDLDGSLDLYPERSLVDDRPWFKGEGTEEADKIWSVTITPDMMSRALRLADHQLIARRDNRPPKGISPVALVENLMKKWMPKLRRARKSTLFDKIDSGRYGYDTMKRALDNLVKQDLIHVEGDPKDLSSQKKWVIVWVGDGRKTKKWVETRGGARKSAGRKKTPKEPVS